ncbi:MAG: TetR/AcrR family transcriptional regulator [Akkermansiaceae bacterium]|nr:TetR/AcrR family transcriptional regulator [Armatimonadota bacterium]
MARPRKFDECVALREATALFRENGYEGTSLADLTRRMGMGKASLYATFGDKQQLFLLVLAHYQEAMRETMEQLLAKPGSAREALQGYFDYIVGDSGATCMEGDPGCLCVNTAVELAPHDPLIAARSRAFNETGERLLRETLERGKASGEFRGDLDTRRIAAFLMTQIYGLSVLRRTGPEPGRLTDVVRTALSLLD